MATLITGASSGIGFELTKLCSKHGQHVIMVASDAKKLADAKRKILEIARARVDEFAIDLRDANAPSRLIKQLDKQGIAVDILINNAGFGAQGEFWNIPLDEHINMMSVNMIALTQLTHLVLPQMLEAGRGRIMNVASTAAFQPGPYMAVYYASKAYVLSFSQGLNAELVDQKNARISVTALCPGPTSTNFASRAGVAQLPLFRSLKNMGAAQVAAAGFEGMMKGREVVIPGRRNAIMSFAGRFIPQFLKSRLVKRLQKQPKQLSS